MNNQNTQNKPTTPLRSVREVMDRVLIQELVDGGMSERAAQQKIEESHLMMARYEQLLVKGYTEEQIDALWKDKTPQEILAGASVNVS